MSILDKPELYMPRVIDREIEFHLVHNGAVCIEGPRRCGKTWTGAYHCESGIFLNNPFSLYDRQNVEESPISALDGPTPRLVDEWQSVPSLWDDVVYVTDRRMAKGQFVLTGSASPVTLKDKRVKSGQIKRTRMRTMSLYETGDSSGEVSLKALCDGDLASCDTGEVTLDRLVYLMARGGWPSSLASCDDEKDYPGDYVTSIISGDVRNISDGGYIMREMENLLRALARHEAGTPSMRRLVNDVYGKEASNNQIVLKRYEESIGRYLDFYDKLYLFDNTRGISFSGNPSSPERVGAEETRYFCDVSLACALLGIRAKHRPETVTEGYRDTLGRLFESLCVHDLKVYAQSFGGKVYHYRKNRPDGYDDEIDAVIELEDGRTCAFEVKLGAGQTDAASVNLLRICDGIRRDGGTPPSVLCVICGTTDRAYRRDDGVFVVPITAMRP